MTLTNEDVERIQQAIVHELEDQLAPIKEELGTIKVDIVSMKGDIGTMKEDIVCMKGDIVSMKGDIGTMKEDIVSVKGEIGSMKEEIVSINKKLEVLDPMREALKQVLRTQIVLIDDMADVKVKVNTLTYNSPAKSPSNGLDNLLKAIDR